MSQMLQSLRALKNLLPMDLKVKLKDNKPKWNTVDVEWWDSTEVLKRLQKNICTILKMIYIIKAQMNRKEMKKFLDGIKLYKQGSILLIKFNLSRQILDLDTLTNRPQNLLKSMSLTSQNLFLDARQELQNLKNYLAELSFETIHLKYGLKKNLSLKELLQMYQYPSKIKEKTFPNGDRMHKFQKEFSKNNHRQTVDLCYIFYNPPKQQQIYFGEYDELNRPTKSGWLFYYTDEEFQLIFDGDFFEGFRHGYGKEYKNKRLVYEGRYLHDVYHGEGSFFDDMGNKWCGTFDCGRKHGVFKNQNQQSRVYHFDIEQFKNTSIVPSPSQGPMSATISRDFEMDLNSNIFNTLNGTQWVNSTAVDYILQLLQKQVDYEYENKKQKFSVKKQDQIKNPRILILTTRFSSDVLDCPPNTGDFDTLKTFHYQKYIKYETQSLTGFYDRIIIPVNQQGHFFLVYVNITQENTQYYAEINSCDSLGNSLYQSKNKLLQQIALWLEYEKIPQIRYGQGVNLTLQLDGYNCGLHMIYHCYLLSFGYGFEHNLFERTFKQFSQNKIQHFRKRLQKIILGQRINLFETQQMKMSGKI